MQFLLALSLVLASAGVSARAPVPPAATDRLTIETAGGERVFQVEIVKEEKDRNRGLMFRKHMAAGHGMLFDYDPPQEISFWMKNTYVPLDIAFIDSAGTVVQVFAAKPLDETVLVPSKQYRYVLEVNQGWFERHSLGAGAKVTLPPNLPPAE